MQWRHDMKIAAVITARSTSSRFPRKQLAMLGGLTMIEQIIKKLQYLENLDQIILSTTVNETDDELCEVASKAGATLNRGPEHDLLARDMQAIFVHDIDAVIPIFGDSPFVSNAYIQVLIDALRAEPNPEQYDHIIGLKKLCDMPGFGAGIKMKSAYEKDEMLMRKYKDEYSYEQYWIAEREEPELFKTLEVDTSHISPPEVTPMKLSIDWRLENLFWNKVIDWLGYFPETVEDFNKAFGGIEEL